MATLAAGLLVSMSLILALVPVPFVTWGPGSTLDLLAVRDGKPSVDVSNTDTYPSTGELLLLTVAQSRSDAPVSLPEALLAFWRPNHAVLPREFVYPQGTSQQQQQNSDMRQMNTAQTDAIVAALRLSGKPVAERPVVTQITNSGPASNVLELGDFVTAVDGVPTPTPDAVYTQLATKIIGTTVTLSVLRERQLLTVPVNVVGANTDKNIPVIGARFEIGYDFNERVRFNIDPDIVGSSGGLMFALTIYDRVTDRDIPHGRRIAGTGKINAAGGVDAIGGVTEKLKAAENAGASVFLVPTANCGDLAGVKRSVRVVRVSRLADAVTSLSDLDDPAKAAKVPTC